MAKSVLIFGENELTGGIVVNAEGDVRLPRSGMLISRGEVNILGGMAVEATRRRQPTVLKAVLDQPEEVIEIVREVSVGELRRR